LAERIREKKLPDAAQALFRQLQDQAAIENVLADPIKQQALPGIAAKVNGEAISLNELAEECIARHGLEVLEGLTDRLTIEQETKTRGVNVTQADIDAEIARAAVASGIVGSDGQPDLERWLATVTQQPGITRDIYVRDVVWPTVALKKLVSDQVEVTEDDIQKGYEANYGPRVICRAIVLQGNDRHATEVWQLARENPTVENFAQLAEKYSIEVGSQSQGGQVPPLQRHGGQPALEEEAFRLKIGELSGIIQVGDKAVILFCEGRTNPVDVTLEEVRSLIHDDVYEKKYRLVMMKEYDRLKRAAEIDNFLAGTSQSPKAAAEVASRPASGPAARGGVSR
jgi:parvulin-like peptidyl-prolyl isomerase